jgi:hypothetical protein
VPTSIAVRASDGSVAVGGTVKDVSTIPFGASSQQSTGTGLSVGFVAQYDAGGSFQFARILSSLSGTAICETFIGGVAFDPQGMLVASGTAGGYDATHQCKYTADYANNQTTPDFMQNPMTFALLLLRYDPKTGGRFAAATVSSRTQVLGYPQQLAIGPKGDAYATFENEAAASFTFGASNVPASKSTDGVLLHYDSNGAEAGFFVLQSTEYDDLFGVAVDPWGSVVVAGRYGAATTVGKGQSLPFTKPDGSTKNSNAVLLKLSPNLADVLWAYGYDGVGQSVLSGVSIGPGGIIGAHGQLGGGSVSLGGGKAVSPQGGTDGFVMLLAP